LKSRWSRRAWGWPPFEIPLVAAGVGWPRFEIAPVAAGVGLAAL
jgi:hypothetical protein